MVYSKVCTEPGPPPGGTVILRTARFDAENSAVNSTAEPSDTPLVLDWDRALHSETGDLEQFAMWVIWTPVATTAAGSVPSLQGGARALLVILLVSSGLVITQRVRRSA